MPIKPPDAKMLEQIDVFFTNYHKVRSVDSTVLDHAGPEQRRFW